METKPKITVIIPTYNRKECLAEAIDSVLNQTCRDFEVVVVDDGSTDNTREFLAEKYGEQIRYFFKENGGCATARNFGLKVARGDYIAFLDSDDRYLLDKLEIQSGILDRHPETGFVYSDAYSFCGDRQVRVHAVRPDREGSIVYPLFATTFLSNGSFLLRRRCLDAVGYYDEQLRYNEDTDFFLRIALHCQVRYSEKPTFAYRVHGGRKSSNILRLLEALYYSSENFLRQHPAFREKIGTRGEKRLGQIKLDISLEYVQQHDWVKATEELTLSQKLYPTLKKRIYAYLFMSNFLPHPLIFRMVFFVETLQKTLKFYLYKYMGWI